MKLNILYFLYKSILKSAGKCVVKCRIIFCKNRKEFTIGLFINPKNWNSKQQYVEPPEPDAEIINSKLSLIRTKLNQAFLFLQVK